MARRVWPQNCTPRGVSIRQSPDDKIRRCARERLRIYITGDCEGLHSLREALEQHPELELVGTSERVAQASSALAGGTPMGHEGFMPRHDLTDRVAEAAVAEFEQFAG